MMRDDVGVVEHRYDTKENWTLANPVLARGELGVEIEYGFAKLKVGDGETHWNGLDYVSGGTSNVAAGVPNGSVVAFSGTFDQNNNPIDVKSNKPCTGWLLCDGTKGTPDLRGRFIVCASANRVSGSSGGEETHILTVNEMPVHGHTGTTNATGGHVHTIYRAGNGGGNWDGAGLAGSPRNDYAGYVNSNSSGNHSHILSVNSTGGNQAHNNMPPYYALAYIMKIQG